MGCQLVIQSTLRQVAWNWQLTSSWSWRKRVEVRRTNTLWPGKNGSFQGEIEASIWSVEKYFLCYVRTPLKCKGIQDCLGFQIPFHGFRIPGTEFQSLMVELGFWTSIVSEIPYSKVHDSWFHRQNFLRFRVPREKLLGFRNPDFLYWRRQVTRLEPLPENDVARRPATLYSKSRRYSRYPFQCSFKAPELG